VATFQLHVDAVSQIYHVQFGVDLNGIEKLNVSWNYRSVRKCDLMRLVFLWQRRR